LSILSKEVRNLSTQRPGLSQARDPAHTKSVTKGVMQTCIPTKTYLTNNEDAAKAIFEDPGDDKHADAFIARMWQ
jgi:hypothetical protein